MKRTLILIFSGMIGTAGIAQAGPVFSCKTDNNKYIEVDKINPNLYEYLFGSMGKKEIVIRNGKSERKSHGSAVHRKPRRQISMITTFLGNPG